MSLLRPGTSELHPLRQNIFVCLSMDNDDGEDYHFQEVLTHLSTVFRSERRGGEVDARMVSVG